MGKYSLLRASPEKYEYIKYQVVKMFGFVPKSYYPVRE